MPPPDPAASNVAPPQAPPAEPVTTRQTVSGHGTQSMIPGADLGAAEAILSRLKASVGGVLRKNIASGDVIAAATIVVTASGALHWEVIEPEIKKGEADQKEKSLQVNNARLALVEASTAIRETAKNAILSSLQ